VWKEVSSIARMPSQRWKLTASSCDRPTSRHSADDLERGTPRSEIGIIATLPACFAALESASTHFASSSGPW